MRIWQRIRNNMKNFLILTNEKKDPGLRISKKIQDYIEKQGGISQRMCDFTRHELHHKRHRVCDCFRWRWDDASCGKIDRRS